MAPAVPSTPVLPPRIRRHSPTYDPLRGGGPPVVPPQMASRLAPKTPSGQYRR